MNGYISDFIKRRVSARIYLVNGFQMCCVIREQGDNYIVVQVGGHDKMVYKHAISTIEAA